MTALAADPTLDFLRKLDDPNLWVVIPNVPIFKPHRRVLPGGKVVHVTAADLPKIAARCQQRYGRDGVPIRITLGHSLPGQPQPLQPERAGYGRNVRVGTFGPAQEPCLLAEFRIRRDAWPDAREYPYRSVEYFPDSYDLTGVALLKTDPQLDLGILDPVIHDPLAYAAAGPCYHYAMEGKMPDPTDPPMATPPAPTGPDGVPPEFNEHFVRCARHHFPHLYEAAAPGMPGPGDTFIPGAGGKKPHEYQRPAAQPPAPAITDPIAQLRAELAAERQAREAAQREHALAYARQQCGLLCDQLELAGYQFNREKTIERLVPLDAAGRKAEIDDLMQYSRQAPVGGDFLPVVAGPASPNSKPKEATPEEGKAAMSLAYERGWHDAAGYDRALAEVRGGKK